MPPSIFGDCFRSCSGSINDVSLGPVCGWTFNQDFGPSGGSIILTPGQATFVTTGALDFPGMTKTIPNPKTNWNGVSFLWTFQEFTVAPNAGTTYQVYVKSVDGAQAFTVNLFGDGSIVVQVGPPATINNYLGTWVPAAGTVREAYLTIDAAGVPRLFLNSVEVPLTFSGTGLSPADFVSANTINVFASSADAAATQAVVSSVFLTDGNPGPATEFCCT